MDEVDAPLRELGPVWADAPRHVPGLVLPRYRFVPELHPHPRNHPEGSLHGQPEPDPGLPEDRWHEDATYLGGIDLYHQGYLWEAHEYWEQCFFVAADRAHKLVLQSLIQLAAALLNVHRGKPRSVPFLAGRVAGRLRRAIALRPGERIAGLDPAALLADVERHFAAALGDGPDSEAGRVVGEPPRLVLVGPRGVAPGPDGDA
jgi:hypothetical protein